VRDSGSGISPESLPHIFDRFWHLRGASRARGTGLGLAIARGIVTAHGGRIWVESEVGIGSSFFFTLSLVTLPMLRSRPTALDTAPRSTVPRE
jgi:signal transduction histidine kinase